VREKRHQLEQDVAGQLVRDAPAVPVRGDRRHGAPPDPGELVGAQTALHVRRGDHVRELPIADP
jgi:hypothetical protein